MTVFSRLGLEENATEAEVKRAYARLLKTTRPDGDPVAFQQLQEAYNACLQRVRYRQAPNASMPVMVEAGRLAVPEADESDQETIDAVPRPFLHPSANHDIPEFQAPPRAFDLAEFMDAFAQKLLAGQARALDLWLHGLGPLYSLQLKQSLRPVVAQFLAEMERPPSPASLEVALVFFGLDQLSGGHVARHVAQAMQRSEAAERFDRSWREHTSWHRSTIDRMLMQELKGPTFPLRRLFLLLMPQLPGRMQQLAVHFLQLDAVRASALLDLGSMLFWQQAADRTRLARPRWVVGLVRIPVYAFGLSLLINVLTGPPIRVPLFLPMLAWSSGLWLTYAGGLIGLSRLGRWMAWKWEWDRPVQVTMVLAALALIALPFSGVITFLLLTPAILTWISGRGTGASWLAMLALFTGIALWSSLVAPLLLDIDWVLALVFVPVTATLVGQDMLHARIRRVPLFLIRRDRSWLGWLAACNLAMLAAYWLIKSGIA